MDHQSTTKTWIVYILARPDGRPFYIGKGSRRRVFDHETEARSGCRCHKCNVIRKIWRGGGDVQRFIVLETDNESDAFAYEVELIAIHGRKNLTNLTEGGEGVSGHVHTSEARAKMSAHLAKTEVRAVLSASMKARWANPDYRAKSIAALKAVKSTPEYRARQSVRIKAALADPETRAKHRTALQSPEYHARMSASIKASWSDPEKRAKHIDSITPEVRAKRSAATKAAWARRRAAKEQEE